MLVVLVAVGGLAGAFLLGVMFLSLQATVRTGRDPDLRSRSYLKTILGVEPSQSSEAGGPDHDQQ